jgi:hypothetical protein
MENKNFFVFKRTVKQNEQLINYSEPQMYSWTSLFFKTYMFVGIQHSKLNRTMYHFIENLRFDYSLMKLYSVLYELKKIFVLLKFFSYKSNKYQKFYFLLKDKEFLNENKSYVNNYFFRFIDLNENPGNLVKNLLIDAHKPRCIFYLADKHGFSFLNKAQKLGVLNVNFNNLVNSGRFSNYLVPWNFDHYFSLNFLFNLILFFIKRDRFLYFSENF